MKYVVASLEEIPPGGRKIVEVAGRSIGVFNVRGELFALRNRCPHQGGPLCMGRIAPWARSSGPGDFSMEDEPALIACPWHGWEYELSSGQSFLGPGEPRVKAYDVLVEKGDAIVEEGRRHGREPGPYVAETFPVYVEEDYVVLDA